jgi:predicted RNA-binding Zn ribbon-like protein
MSGVDLGVVHAFLNSRDERRFGMHAEKSLRDHIASAAALKRWLVARDLVPPRLRVTDADAHAAREVRDCLREVVAGGDGEALSELGRRYPLVVSFDGEPALAPPQQGVAGFLGAVFAECANAVVAGRWARLKMCAADDCRFVFYDHARNGLGRWCAMEACGSRMKSRSYRARHAEARRR